MCCGKLSKPQNFGIADDETTFDPEAMPEHEPERMRPARGLGRGRGISWERGNISRETAEALRASLRTALARLSAMLEG